MRQIGTIERMGDDRATWTLRNDSAEALLVHLEPEGDQIEVRSGSTLVIRVAGGERSRGGEPPLDVSAEGRTVTVWSQWPGSSVTVLLDGREI